MDTRTASRRIPTWRIRAKMQLLTWAHERRVPFSTMMLKTGSPAPISGR